jgi:hypothetical protein
MATNTYTADENGQVFAGRFNRPSWLRSQPVNTWGVVPTANVLADINPRNNPALNPNFPNKPEWEATGSFSAIITAWCGAVNNDYEQIIPFVAGHADYAGGESYRLKLNTDNPIWEMIRPPTGALPDAVVTNDGQEATGLYADGRPRAVHTYNKIIWIPSGDIALVPQGRVSWSAANGTRRAITISPTSGEMTLFGAELGIGDLSEFSGSGTCWDSSRGLVWHRGPATGRFRTWNPATNEWNTNASNSVAVSGSTALEYIPAHDCILWINGWFANNFAVLDCSTGVIHQPDILGDFVGMSVSGECQPRRISDNQFAMWDNSTSTQSINIMSFSGDPRAATWQVSQLPVGGVTPSTRTTRGTYGRFMYSEKLGIFAVTNAVDQPTYFYRYK